ncbi:MAG: proline dehydrogenase family protein [Candidatus Micrarchaeaceae archaeon]
MPSGFLERLISGRWIAGPSASDAIRRAKQLNALNERAIINFLGEEFTDKERVINALHEYLGLISSIKQSGVKADISLKPTQLGLRIGYAYAAKNYAKVLRKARTTGVFVWLDMESSDTVSSTIAMYRRALVSGEGAAQIGICLQAYLRRTQNDIRSLVNTKAVIRLVKGAYKENAKLAFQKRQDISKNYLVLMRYLFKNYEAFTIASHDRAIIAEAEALNRAYQKQVTYAFLSGIRPKLAKEMATKGEQVSVYVPYGKLWLDYAYRRIREQGHTMLVLRSLFGG